MTRIPSYDDLTPGIPDVVDSENVDRLTVFLGEDLRRSTGDREKPASNTPERPIASVFACLRALDRQPPPATRERHTLLAVARDFSPRVRRVGDGEILLDVSGLGRLIGEPPEIARQLTRAIEAAGVKGRVAVASTQTKARLLAMAAAPGTPGVREDVAGLSVPLLRTLETLPPGMNHRDRDRPYAILERWGIATLGELAALPPGDLWSRLGRRGVALHRLARGLDPAPFVPEAETPRYIGRLELAWPIDTLEPLSFVFARLLDPLAIALARADRGAAAIHLELRLTDRSTLTRLLQLPAAMRDPRVLRTLLLLDLESHSLFGRASEGPSDVMIDIVRIELDPAPARITQFSLLQRALPSPETLATLTARLSALVGEGCVGSPVLLDTHRPDGFAMARYGVEGTNGAKGANGANGANGAGANGANGAGANGANGAAVLRRCRRTLALCVSVSNGRPVHIAASRQGIPSGAITQAAGPWRTSGGWWTDEHWNRNEWDVAFNSGAVCRIVQDRLTDRWFLEGLYD